MTRGRFIAVLAPVLLLLSACSAPTPAPTTAAPQPVVQTPSPSPTATPSPIPVVAEQAGPPALSDLVLTPDGFGTLSIGAPIDPQMAVFDPLGCRTPANEQLDYEMDDPIWNAFIPTYEQISEERDGHVYSYYPFQPSHDRDDHTLRWLRIRSPEILTDRGIGIGSSEADLVAAYPDAVVFDKGPYYRSYNIDGESGRLGIEVTGRNFDISQPIEVWTMYLTPLDGPLYSMGGGDGGGFCDLQS